MKRPTRLVLASLSVLLACGCYTVPETGRRALILPGLDDVQLGAAAFADTKTKEKISTDAAALARVKRVGGRIAQAVGAALPGAQWEFVVFDAPETVNAFALPGGKVGVYTGLLLLAENDDELAFVMGHEIAHVTSRHGAERMTEGAVAAALGVLVDASAKGSENHDLILGAYAVGATGATLAFSRGHESEADRVGLIFTAKAGYDPRASVRFWQKMAAQGKQQGKLPELLSTHPSDERRIAALNAEMPKVMPTYEASRGKF